MQSTTLGSYDINTELTYSLVPALVWNEIKLGERRREAFIYCTEQQDFAGVTGNKVNVPVLGRDEFTASSLTESEMDADGMTKTKLSPDSIQIDMADVVYVATKISDILLEDSPTLGWVRASLQKMGEALTYKREDDLETVLYAGAGHIVSAETGGTLAYNDLINAKQEMEEESWYDDSEPALAFINPEQKADLLKAKGDDAPFETERYQGSRVPFVGYPMFGGCVINTTTVMRDGFALVVQSPRHPFGAAVLAAWKRRPKAEKWRGGEAQYQRTAFSLSERRGFGIAYSNAVALISGC